MNLEAIIFATLAALIGLPIGGKWCLRHEHPAAAWTMFGIWAAIIITIIGRIFWVRREATREKNVLIAQRQRDGLRKRHQDDQEVSHTEWQQWWAEKGKQRWIDWVEGEARTLKPDDILFKWGAGMNRVKTVADTPVVDMPSNGMERQSQ